MPSSLPRSAWISASGPEPRWAALRLLATGAGVTLLFDAAVFLAMAVMGWKLVMPWREALTAGESLMAICLLVCSGLWASISAEDLYRWRKLYRRWSSQAARSRPAAAYEVTVAALASTPPEPSASLQAAQGVTVEEPGLRVRSIVRPSRARPSVMHRSSWHVVSRSG